MVLALGAATPASAVVGGKPAESVNWQWMAQLHVNGVFNCGASLIAPAVAVTAAHCTYDGDGVPLKPHEITLTLGRSKLSGLDGERHQAVRIIRHERYDGETIDNDVALVVLATPSARPPVTLASASQQFRWEGGRQAYVLGWGRTSQQSGASDVLRLGTVRMGSQTTCRSAWKRWLLDRGSKFNTATMLCASAAKGATGDTCNGDSGGPLFVFRSDGAPTLAGVTSWGSRPCEKSARPSVYTRVGAGNLTEWVRRKLSGLAPRPTTPQPTPPSSGPAPQPAMLGRWVGPLVQSPSASRSYGADVRLTQLQDVGMQAGAIDYPELSCGGTLTYLGPADGNGVKLLERITYGSCIDSGIVTLTPVQDVTGLAFLWVKEGSEVTVEGTLRRPAV